LDSSAYAAYRMAGVTTTIAGIKFAEDTFFVYGGNNGGPVTGFEEYVISQQGNFLFSALSVCTNFPNMKSSSLPLVL